MGEHVTNVRGMQSIHNGTMCLLLLLNLCTNMRQEEFRSGC